MFVVSSGCSHSGVLLQLVNLYVYQIDVVLPCFAEAILELGVVVGIHLIALQVDLEGGTLLHSLVPYVVEPLVADQVDRRRSEVRVELEHGLQELDGLGRRGLEPLGQALTFQLTLHLIGVDECALICQVGEVLVTALAKDFEDLDELVVLTNLCRS